MLFADPSEKREGTRLPHQVVVTAKSCAGLEERTGADLLYSPLNIPATSDVLLRRHTKAGVLIQRKIASDFIASVTDGRLFRSEARMLEWSNQCWLVVIGRIQNKFGTAAVGGRESLAYASVQGALDYWQLRGGYVSQLSDDSAFVEWLNHWPSKLKAISEHGEHVIVKQPLQTMTVDRELDMLVTLPGMGVKRARALMEFVEAQGQPGLARALVRLTNSHGNGAAVPGIGEETVAQVRAWLGLSEDEHFTIADERLVEVLAYLMGRMEAEYEVARAHYATVAEWLGLECVGYEDKGGWKAWAEARVKSA